MKVNIKKLDERAIIPTYGTEFSAGADLYALLDSAIEILHHETTFVRTGISVEIPVGYCGLIFARSSMGAKRGLAPANKVGVIDADYRGELVVWLLNTSDQPLTVSRGDRVAQLVFQPVCRLEPKTVDSLSETERGSGGFGHTGRS